MCELLIRVKNSPMTGDVVFDSKVSRAGDVIHVAPDGWPWGNMEMKHDFWRIVKLPGVPLKVGEVLLGGEKATGAVISRTLQPRLNRFILNHPGFPAALAAWLADDTRAVPAHVFSQVTTALTGAGNINFGELFVAKTPIPDPAIIAPV